MISEKIPQIRELTEEEKLQLAEELWESASTRSEAFPITEEQKKILKNRWKDYKDDPESASSWDEVKKRVFTQ